MTRKHLYAANLHQRPVFCGTLRNIRSRQIQLLVLPVLLLTPSSLCTQGRRGGNTWITWTRSRRELSRAATFLQDSGAPPAPRLQ